ncbi:MAG TPA: SHOCT domain-containing protein [Dehalococcoidia bacterium]|nr:SHOCT domain-containing protein [Dehalococcoidia bacterium]
MWYGDMGSWGWMVIGGGLMWFAFLATVALIVWVAVRPGARGTGGPHRSTPLDILSTRYARGEISRTEFEQAKRDLT